MVTLWELYYAALGGISIFISEPYNYSGNVFDEDDEKALVDVEVGNSTELTFRDVVVEIYASQAVEISPIKSPMGEVILFDGEESWDELKPYDSKKFIVRIKGKHSGNGYLLAYVSAEIVPYDTRYRTTRKITVHPA